MGCECEQVSTDSDTQRSAVRTALVLNLLMVFTGGIAGLYGQSISILADAADMAADASGYGLSLLAIGRGGAFRRRAARWTGATLVVLGVLVLVTTIRHWALGSAPLGPVMMGYSALSLAVNLYVLFRLAKVRDGGVHLDASYVCTRVDVLANVAVLTAGAIVWITGAAWVDWLTGAGISVLVFSEAREIFEQARPPTVAHSHR